MKGSRGGPGSTSCIRRNCWPATRDGLVDLARAIVATGDNRIVLELWNEPPGGYSGSEGVYWLYTQPDLIKAVRVVAPKLPVVASGDRGGGHRGPAARRPAQLRRSDDPVLVPLLRPHGDHPPGRGLGHPARVQVHGASRLPARALAGVRRDRRVSRPGHGRRVPPRTRTSWRRRGRERPRSTITSAARKGRRRSGRTSPRWATGHGRTASRASGCSWANSACSGPMLAGTRWCTTSRMSAPPADGLGAPWAAFNYAPLRRERVRLQHAANDGADPDGLRSRRAGRRPRASPAVAGRRPFAGRVERRGGPCQASPPAGAPKAAGRAQAGAGRAGTAAPSRRAPWRERTPASGPAASAPGSAHRSNACGSAPARWKRRGRSPGCRPNSSAIS